MNSKIIGALLFVVGGMFLLGYTSRNQPLYDLPQVVKPPKLKKDVSFAGELIPMNVDTRERMEREMMVNSYYHSATIMALKNAPRYFPTIERILAEEGVPDDFKYLAVAESNLTNASSGAGAKGVWQFMKAASSDYGLEISAEVDERGNIEKATRAACKYLKQLYASDGSWINAAAAYNVGPGNLKKILANQGEKSFFDVNLNEETSRYVFRLVTIKEIMKAPEAFGYYLDESDKYAPLKYYELEVNSSIPSLSEFAHQHGITYRMLKVFNPWLIDNKLTVKDKVYTIKIPTETE